MNFYYAYKVTYEQAIVFILLSIQQVNYNNKQRVFAKHIKIFPITRF